MLSSLKTLPSPLGRKFLILDLDETLVHCRPDDFDNVTVKSRVRVGDQFIELYVSKRPGLEEFMARMALCYNLILFTSALKDYAHSILRLMKIDHYFSAVYHRSHCQKNSENKFEKDLAIFGIHPRDIILVDDSIVHVRNQPNNILLVKPYKGERNDNELSKLATFLEEIANKPDVRPVMEGFVSYELNKEPKGVPSQLAGSIPNLGTKPFPGRVKSLSWDKYPSGVVTADCDFGELSENHDGADLTPKVPALNPRKKSILLKLEINALFDSETREDDESTEDSAEELPIRPSKKSISEAMTQFPLAESTAEPSGLVDKLPTMKPKSQFDTLKSSVSNE